MMLMMKMTYLAKVGEMLQVGVEGWRLVDVDKMVVLVVAVVDCTGCSSGGGSRCGRYSSGGS